MGLHRLKKVIDGDFSSYVVKNFKNGPVIVTGKQFFFGLLKNANESGAFGQDYAEMRSIFLTALENFKLCGMDPIFVFNGIPPRYVSMLFTY